MFSKVAIIVILVLVVAEVAFLLVCAVVVKAIVPVEEFHIPKPYSFGYAIKDKHGEQHRQEIGDGLHSVKGSYGFKDERGIERLVNYVADEGGFRAEVKTNEPGTAPMNPAAVKMESSAHPYFGIAKEPIATGVANVGFELPDILKLDAAELVKNGLAFDTGLAKKNELEKEALRAELAKEGLDLGAAISLENLAKQGFAISPAVAEGFAKEGFAFSPQVAGGFAKEAEAAKSVGLGYGSGLEELLKKGYTVVPFDMETIKGAALEKEGLSLAKELSAEELVKMGFASSPLLEKKSNAFGLKAEELQKEGLALGYFKEPFLFTPKVTKEPFSFLAPVPYTVPKPKGFAYGGSILGGFVKGYDARFF